MSNSDFLVQCVLVSGNEKTECYLEPDKIKVGYRVTLKDSADPEQWWTIESIGTPIAKHLIHDDHDSKNWHDKDCHIKFGNRP